MKINYVNDVMVPAAVGGIQLGLKMWDDKRLEKNPGSFEYEPIAPYVIGIGGTAARVFNVMPKYDDMLKMAAAASMPRVITGLYDWVKKDNLPTPAPTGRRISARRVASQTPEFKGLKVV